MRQCTSLLITITGLLSFGLGTGPATAAPGDDIYETCPDARDTGPNVECYPLTFVAKTEVHPDGIPLIAYLFVPRDRPAEPLPAIVFAHGSSGMYSSGNHNKGLSSKHVQWVKQYTNDLGIVGLHVSSFHSRYLLPDSPDADCRIFDITTLPDCTPGGDDYRATSTLGGNDRPSDAFTVIAFDPEQDDWKDQSNGRAGISEAMERAYDMDAAWEFLAGYLNGTMTAEALRRNRREDRPTLGTPDTETGRIGDIVDSLVIHPKRIFMYGTSHGGQTAITASHAPRALADENPMNDGLSTERRQRFAGFLDFYGGCNVYGVYGGSKFDPDDPLNPARNSQWRPYAPFLLIAGEYDDTTFDNLPVNSREKWNSEPCGKRFNAAKADPGFDVFLEAAVYRDAYHSFDGVERSDFGDENDTGKGKFHDWLAKMHSNHRVVMPLMEAVSRIAAAEDAGDEPPTLASLGFSASNAYFQSVPLEPFLPPQPDFAELPADGMIPIDALDGFTLDLNTIFRDPFEYYPTHCSLGDAPANVSLDQESCRLQVELDQDQIDKDLPALVEIMIRTSRGRTLIPAYITGDSKLDVSRAIETLPTGASLLVHADTGINVDLRSLAWRNSHWEVPGQPDFRPHGDAHAWTIETGDDDTDHLLRGLPPVNPFAIRNLVQFDGGEIGIKYTLEDAGEGLARITLDSANFASSDDDFSDDDGSGGDGSGGDGSGRDGSGGDGSGGGGSGGGGSGGGGSGGGGSGGGGSGGGGSGGGGSGGSGSGGGGSGGGGSGGAGSGGGGSGGGGSGGGGSGGGGGALFWLLPMLWLRAAGRKRH